MWNKLWKDFNARTERLIANRAMWAKADAVDTTIIWQILGRTCYCPTPIPESELHLPELYSGAPWGAAGTHPWIAFVTLNPSIDSRELFPTLENFNKATSSAELDPLISFFDNRFCFPEKDVPFKHGRRDNRRLTVWKGTTQRPTRHNQKTWDKIEEGLRLCLSGTRWADPPMFLGRIAGITDAVPWKFAKWASVPKPVQQKLLAAGSDYLSATLRAHPPNAIVSCGRDFKSLPKGHVLDGPNPIMRGGRPVPWFKVSAPTARPTVQNPNEPFLIEMQALREQFLEALDN